MFLKRLLAFFVPSAAALPFIWAAPPAVLILCAAALVMALSEREMEASLLPVISLCAIPTGGLLLGLATWLERKPGPRLLLWGGVNLLMAASASGMFLFNSQLGEVTLSTNFAILLCVCLPVLAVPASILLILGFRAYPVFRQALRSARLQRVVEIIQARGEINMENLGTELSLKPSQCAGLVRDLVSAGELMAILDEENSIVYSAAALGEKQRRLLAMINAQGKAHLDDLAREIKVHKELVEQWIYDLSERRQLHGYVDWKNNMVHSQKIKALLAQNKCPQCGGRLEVAGRGLIACEYCGVEIFR